jgi:hypothetical protein
MTNGTNYKRGKLHHSPWHSDIHTSNQLNSDTSNAVTNHMTQDENLAIVRMTQRRKNKKQHAVGCKCIHIEAIAGQ